MRILSVAELHFLIGVCDGGLLGDPSSISSLNSPISSCSRLMLSYSRLRACLSGGSGRSDSISSITEEPWVDCITVCECHRWGADSFMRLLHCMSSAFVACADVSTDLPHQH